MYHEMPESSLRRSPVSVVRSTVAMQNLFERVDRMMRRARYRLPTPAPAFSRS